MTSQSDFTQKEWELLARSPFDVVMGVAAIDADTLSGASDTPIELSAGVKGLVELGHKFPDHRIIRYVFDTMDEADMQQALADRSIAAHSLDELLQTCRGVAQLLDEKATRQEAREFKQYLLMVANEVAAAAGGVGGFQGFGRKRVSPVSDREAQALKKIAAALRA
jgi:hypothetical protein